MLKWLDKQEWFNFTVLSFFLAVVFFPVVWFFFFGTFPDFLFCEDGIYESVAAILCLSGGLLLLGAFYYSDDSGRSKRNNLLFLFAIALLFLAGEEISWGQRFFGFHWGGINELPTRI